MNSTKKPTVNYVDTILICRFWLNQHLMAWNILMCWDRVRNSRFTRGKAFANLSIIFFLKYASTCYSISSTPILHRCIPTGLKAPGETVRSAYEQLNSWSVSQQLLSDLYTTWPVMVSMYFVALGKLSRFSFLLPHTSIHQSTKNNAEINSIYVSVAQSFQLLSSP